MPKKNRSKLLMQIPVIRSMEELRSKLGEKAYLELQKRIESDNKKRDEG
jgi:hypothetical protein